LRGGASGISSSFLLQCQSGPSRVIRLSSTSHIDKNYELGSSSMTIPADSSIDAILIGFENQENLGLRSMIAYLRKNGYQSKLIPFFPKRHEEVLSAILHDKPKLVGFSLIFQYSIDDFGQMMKFLRSNGIAAHFTAGGHFPSLQPKQTMDLLPELDSIVRFEGELTLLELLNNLNQPKRWNDIEGLVFRNGSNLIINKPRSLIPDLDSLPLIYRDEIPQQAFDGVKLAYMLASRGCLFNCSFCSIRQFYSSSSGLKRRVRSPQAVVDEMLVLYEEKGVRYFSFQDDDFAARTQQQRIWLETFLNALAQAGLSDRIRWKISCRVDDLEPAILERMMKHGLMAVYLGVESGNETGLRTLNKRASVAQNVAAINLLKRYDVGMSIGFMLFDPSSNEITLRENFDFLESVGEDGYFPINFCKMLPYAGTPIEDQLKSAGRIRGSISRPEYNLLSPQLDWYELLVQKIFSKRNFSAEGIVTILQQADFNSRLTEEFGLAESMNSYRDSLRQIVGESNRLAIETLRTLLDEVMLHGAEYLLKEKETFIALAEREWRGEMKAEVELLRISAQNKVKC
jgi:anaerobic magnesium-protoporphyrin IX monomethyl ester cyclase